MESNRIQYNPAGLSNYDPNFNNPLRRKIKKSDNFVATIANYTIFVTLFEVGYKVSYTMAIHNSVGGVTGGFWVDSAEIALPATVAPLLLDDPLDCNHTHNFNDAAGNLVLQYVLN